MTRITRKILLFLTFLMVPGLLTLILSRYHQQWDVHARTAIFAGVLFSVFLFGSFLIYGTGMRTAARTLRGFKILLPVGAIFFLAVLSISLAQPDGSTAPPPAQADGVQPSGVASVSTKASPLATPGVVFVICLALVTVVGFVLTVSKLEEIHGRILDYPYLIERCEHVVRLEKERINSKNGRLYVLANTPGFGNVSAPREFFSYKKVLNDLLAHPEVEVVLACLSWVPDEDGNCAHDQFYAEHFRSYPDLVEKIKESSEMLNQVGGSISGGSEKKFLYALKSEVEEVPFHLILTSERAILFTALSYPRRNGGTESEAQLADSKIERVQVIGMETGDKAIIRALEAAFWSRIKHIAIREDRHPHALARLRKGMT